MLTAVKFKRPGQQNRVYDAETREREPCLRSTSTSSIPLIVKALQHLDEGVAADATVDGLCSGSKVNHITRCKYIVKKRRKKKMLLDVYYSQLMAS